MFKGTVQHAVLRGIEQVVHRTVVRVHAAMIAALMVIGVSAVIAPAAGAQGGGRMGGDSSFNRERKPPTPQQIEERRRMIAEFEQRIDNFVRTRLQASDEQMVKLRALKKRLDVDKEQLFKEERELRGAMRRELVSASPKDAQLTDLLDKWPTIQRRRIEIQEREQKELAKFLTPVQRARFFALDDELRRTRQDTQWGRGDRGTPGMPGMRADSGKGGNYRGGPGGRGGRPPEKDTARK